MPDKMTSRGRDALAKGAWEAERAAEREVEALRLVARGLSNPDIARQLNLSEHTVHRHVSNILTKLDLPTRAAAAAAAAREGVV
ncbi:MAG TPA: LuxR C-terminal-related transcriptional regulator [Blastocatellia bacterium]|nr:LuxR C-terminal-related transcriptional regulator [Blastocatellia bacterium]